MTRPKTRGELLLLLKLGEKAEVMATSQEITSLILTGWGNFTAFKTYPSENPGWVIYEPTNLQTL